MDIIVRKPTDAEIADMKKKPTWTCGVSEFDWYYGEKEECLLTEGAVTVFYENRTKQVSFAEGDYVIFPEGLSCVWKVTAPVKKHYVFG